LFPHLLDFGESGNHSRASHTRRWHSATVRALVNALSRRINQLNERGERALDLGDDPLLRAVARRYPLRRFCDYFFSGHSFLDSMR
jgi:hypothetical protein